MMSRRHYFSIGAVSISLRSDCPSFIAEYRSLYAPYSRSSAEQHTIDVEIRSHRRFPWPRGPYTLTSNDGLRFEVANRFEVLPHLEWFINWHIIRNRSDFVQIHASSLEMDGRGVLLPGDPGCGKSTLTAGLLASGWSYLCDEFALIDAATLMIHPYPRALCMKEPSFPVVDRLGLPLHRKTPYRKATKGRVAFLNPLDVGAHVVGRPSRVRWVIFPKYVAGAQPLLTPMTRSQAAYELTRQCFNFHAYEARAVGVLADVIRGASCYRLISGEIKATCDLMEQLVRGSNHRRARSA